MIQVVLVRSKYPRNIGMVARAMANYGANQLILINPQCDLDQNAREGAAQGQGPLEKVKVYSNWDQFYAQEPEGLRIAFSRRTGKRRESFDFSKTLKEEPEIITREENKYTYLVFGPEDHGLADDDLNYIHRVLHFNLPGKLHSLNLSHSVLNVLTLINEYTGNTISHEKEDLKDDVFFFPDAALKNWLEALNFDISTHSRVNAHTILRRLILKASPSIKELEILEKALQQTIRKLKTRDC